MSSGAAFVDSLIADSMSVPPEFTHLYSESLVYLPQTSLFPATSASSWRMEDFASPPTLFDRKTAVTDGNHHAGVSERASRGPGKDMITFGALGPAARVDPELWGAWMEVLRYSSPSQLWLDAGVSPQAGSNLQKQAEHAGIRPARIVATDSSTTALQAALADVVLDSRSLNAGAFSVVTALRRGAAVLSLPGECLGSRVTASILAGNKLAGMFAVRDVTDYEEAAVRIAAAIRRGRASGRWLRNEEIPSELMGGEEKDTETGLSWIPIKCWKSGSGARNLSALEWKRGARATGLSSLDRALSMSWEMRSLYVERAGVRFHLVVC
jgi:protein O-GlcNAc transferase